VGRGQTSPFLPSKGKRCMSSRLHIAEYGERLIYTVPPHFAKMSYEEVKNNVNS